MGNIWEFAKNIEQEGQAYYTTLARETPVSELKGVFNQMAAEEKKHYDLFEALSQKKSAGREAGKDILGTAKQAFSSIAEGFTKSPVINDSESAYRKALDLEKKSVEYYQDALGKVESPDAKDTLGFIIGEEKKHVKIVEQIVEMVRNPKQWVEDAEFSHIDETF
ncbi:MAG: hypothetical protein GF350_01590 [Chitinivibrionales bacterium]|nr:hypothetical protein [Chitinivibrionales bacterium]